jgi:hypothetical protein
MSNDNVVNFPGLTYAEIEPRKMLEAIAEDQADTFERCIVIAVVEGETLIFTSSGSKDCVIADMARAQHGFIAATFEDE